MTTDNSTSQLVIDADTHVTEPPDLWTSRLPSKWRDAGPHLEDGVWRVADDWLTEFGAHSHAGWREFPPSMPPTIEDCDPATYDPTARLERMSERGIHAAVMYPNILGFWPMTFMALNDAELALACVTAYNDFSTEFASADPNRLIPITVVPFWDLEASVAEITRCREMGHRGILFANKYERAGLPPFTDRYWDPIYSAATDLDLSINFHVGFASRSNSGEGADHAEQVRQLHERATLGHGTKESPPDGDMVVEMVRLLTDTFLGNAPTITRLLTSDVCERYPTLKFVSVESGFGYVPYLLEGLDWSWMNMGAYDAWKDRLMPSEYFKRQCYGTFWFEHSTLPLLEHFPDNFMFETDFPHPAGVSPGPASYAKSPQDHIAERMVGLPEHLVRNALYNNAARVYGI
jgi:uncharacterized protein